MDKIIYLMAIFGIMISYKIMEIFFKRFFPKLINFDLSSSICYYFWGLVLLSVYLIVRPNDYVTKIPINNKSGIIFLIFFTIGVFFAFIYNQDPNVYYPKKEEKLICFNHGIILPIFEEVAFRGLILPMTVCLLGNQGYIIILLNGFLFMLFHLNYYWPIKKELLPLFFNFLVLGIYFSYLALITESIVYSTLCHIILNGGYTLYKNWKTQSEIKNYI
jgi:CAAX prenyl protease-like protein